MVRKSLLILLILLITISTCNAATVNPAIGTISYSTDTEDTICNDITVVNSNGANIMVECGISYRYKLSHIKAATCTITDSDGNRLLSGEMDFEEYADGATSGKAIYFVNLSPNTDTDLYTITVSVSTKEGTSASKSIERRIINVREFENTVYIEKDIPVDRIKYIFKNQTVVEYRNVTQIEYVDKNHYGLSAVGFILGSIVTFIFVSKYKIERE